MKRLIFFILVLLLVLSLPIAVSAEESLSDSATPDQIGSVSSSDAEDSPVEPPSHLPDEIPSDTPSSRSFGETVNYIWDTYAGEIFSVLTLIVSLVLAYFYKRGLVPIVWNGLDRIHRASTAASDAAEALISSTDRKLSDFIEKAEPVLTGIGTAAENTAALITYIEAMDARLNASEKDRALVREVMAGVADMLYGVFTAANLPAYAKEQIGARHAAITAALNGAGGDDNDQEAVHL